MHSKTILADVLTNWDINISKVRDDISIAGSPERVDYRNVIEDESGGLYIAEQVSKDAYEHKNRIASALEYFYNKQLSHVRPYLKSKQGMFLVKSNDCYWQLVDFIEGQELPRPDYIEDGWRGKILADFLIELREKSKQVPGFDKQQVFSIKDYIHDVLISLKYHPEIITKMTPVLNFLEDDFFKHSDKFNSCFCHGDFHPINIVWAENGINAVIDWEFCGYKPEIYDIACMIGCVGIEGPKAFASALVQEFLKRIKESAILESYSFKFMLEYMIALRFAWIAEWVRKDNQDMLEFEIGYTNAMVENADIIKRVLQI